MVYDYIIIGAGLAGSMMGYLLKKNNYNVLVLEKKNIKSKEKLCAGIVTPKAYSILENYFNEKDIEDCIRAKFEKCKISANIEFDVDDIDIKIVNRKRLDSYILDQYLKLGGQVIYGCTIKEIDFEDNKIFTDKGIYEYKKLISSDGVLSCVRKFLTGRFQNKNFALESFQTKTQQTELIIQFIDGYEGYNWIIPLGKNEACIGTGNVSQQTGITDIFDDLAKEQGLKVDKRGAFLPVGNDIILNRGNVYFTGDAAGLISPITGEGIYYALYSACKLFESFENNKDYKKLMNTVLRKIKQQMKLSKIIYNSKIRNNVFKIIRKKGVISNGLIKYVKKILLN